MAGNITEKAITVTLALTTIITLIFIIQWWLQQVTLKLTHLGSGTFRASETEETIFEYTRTEPFALSGYVNLKNMEEEDEVYLRQYVKLAIDDEYTLYAEEPYFGKQRAPLIRLKKLPALRGIKITIQQTRGTPKYFPWEFYGGTVG